MAASALEKTAITLDDLLKLDGVEVIEGELVQMAAAGVEHHLIGGNIHRAFDNHNVKHDLGAVFYDNLTYMMFSQASGLKDTFVPDVSFIRLTDILANFDLTKPYPGVPTLAVEVASPDDKAEMLLQKVRTYLEKGTDEVWVVFPATREVHQYRRDDSPPIRIYRRPDERIDAEAVLPGLELTLEAVFALPAWAKK